jgi:hypothetical protein
MPALSLGTLALLVAAGLAQDKVPERTKVEPSLAAEHVPNGLKAGTRVDLNMVTATTIRANGFVAYSTTALAPDVEVTSVTKLEKPKAPEEAVKVELLVTKEQAARIEKAKAQLVTVVERVPGGKPKTTQKSVPLRLEVPKPDKK